MNRQLRWDDLRLVGAIAAAGSLAGAARTLGVSHATVFRRLGDVEGRLGVKLFERARTGYTPTSAGAEVAEAAGRVAAEVVDVERRVAGRDLRPWGTVRVTTTDTLLTGVLSPIFARFRVAYPDISLEVVVPSQVFSLSRREADVAIRPSSAPPETLVGRRVGTIEQAVYGAVDLVGDAGGTLDLHAMDWIGPDDSMGYRLLERWLARQGLDERCRYRVDTGMGMYAAARDGIGLAALPCYLGEDDDTLARIGDPVPALSIDLWLLTHPDLRHTARVRAVLDFVAEALRERRGRLAATA